MDKIWSPRFPKISFKMSNFNHSESMWNNFLEPFWKSGWTFVHPLPRLVKLIKLARCLSEDHCLLFNSHSMYNLPCFELYLANNERFKYLIILLSVKMRWILSNVWKIWNRPLGTFSSQKSHAPAWELSTVFVL